MATSSSGKPSKKVVSAGPDTVSTTAGQSVPSTVTPESKKQARTLRWIAVGLWVVAIVIECVAVFGLLLKKSIQVDNGDGFVSRYPFFGMNLTQNALFVWVIVLIVVCGVLAIVGSQLWKKANRIDPPSEKNKVRFFIQSQLGMILSLIAFIPLVIIVLLSKNLKGAQKVIVTVVALIVLGASAYAGTELDPSSSEQYAAEQALVMKETGADLVYWVKGGSVYHLCQDSTDLNRPSKDNQIYSGTVGQAHAAGMSRLALRNECGYDNTNPGSTSPQSPEPTATPS